MRLPAPFFSLRFAAMPAGMLALLLSSCTWMSGLGDSPTNGVDSSGGASGDSDSGAHIPKDEPPRAVASMPKAAFVDEVITLDGSASADPQGYPLTGYAWSCDDGTVATGALAEVSFHAVVTVICTLVVTSSSGLVGQDQGSVNVAEIPLPSWTVMIFENGDNELQNAAVDDFNEMEQAGSTSEVNLLVQLDRPVTGAQRYLVHADAEPYAITSEVLYDLGPVDSGSPDVIADFVDWAVAGWPALHYALIFWDHGDGWAADSGLTKGFSYDTTSGSYISVAEGEYETVLASAREAAGRPLDLVGFDACNMASWEVAEVTEPYAEVFVASQAPEGSDGWAYDTALGDLVANPAMDGATLGDRIARRFYESGGDTQSVVDLLSLPALDDALDGLAVALIESGSAPDLFRGAAASSQDFGGNDRDLLDLMDELVGSEGVPDDVILAAEAVQDAGASAILSSYTNGVGVRDAHGESIFAPSRGRLPVLYAEASWSEESLWDDMLEVAVGSP
jgi:hypothetical protein